jgi:regulator of protease activity HflC (stomatin/prohibitin superfamily)
MTTETKSLIELIKSNDVAVEKALSWKRRIATALLTATDSVKGTHKERVDACFAVLDSTCKGASYKVTDKNLRSQVKALLLIALQPSMIIEINGKDTVASKLTAIRDVQAAGSQLASVESGYKPRATRIARGEGNESARAKAAEEKAEAARKAAADFESQVRTIFHSTENENRLAQFLFEKYAKALERVATKAGYVLILERKHTDAPPKRNGKSVDATLIAALKESNIEATA